MKNCLFKAILPGVIVLPALSAAAWAGGSDDLGCSNATLQGAYAFSVLTVVSATGPNVVVGLARFDGRGGYAQIDYPGDGLLMTPPVTDFRTGETGTYTVNPDCTGSAEIDLNVPSVPPGTSHGVIKIMFVISGGGRAFHEVVAEFTPPGATQPVATQTHTDDWRVGSEQDN